MADFTDGWMVFAVVLIVFMLRPELSMSSEDTVERNYILRN